MALAANALTTVQSVKDELGISGSSEDTYIETLINRASDAVERFCNRVFYKTAAIVEKREGLGSVFMAVTRRPLLSITSITLDGNTVDSAGYELHDADTGMIRFRNPAAWTTLVSASIGRDPVPGLERKLYTVTYDGGYVTAPQGGTRTLPYDIEEACVIACVDRYRRKGRAPNVKAESLLSYSVTYSDDDETLATGLPPSARGLLSPWRTIPI